MTTTRPARRVRRATRHHRCARCGYEATYQDASATEARYWFNRHSCAKKERAAVAAHLADLRENAIDRTPKPCHHKQANHQHGTRACYVLDRCRCHPCSAANSTAETERERQKLYGRYQKYVDAHPVRLHVEALRDAGMGLKTIALHSGVAHGALWKLCYGKKTTHPDGTVTQTPSRRVLRVTAEKLYALDLAWSAAPLPLADGAVLSAEASAQVQRRLQALVALGWSMSEIGRRLGIDSAGNATPIIKGERRMVAATARRAEAIFDELCMKLPPADTHHRKVAVTRAKKFASAHGWLPPLALDDLASDADDTSDDLDSVAIDRRLAGDKSVHLTAAEKVEAVRRWTAAGRSVNELERLTGINAYRHRPAQDEAVA